VKFHNPSVGPVGSSDGASGIPSWRRKWIEEKVQRVELECGCIEDLSIPVLTFINTFEGTSIDCVNHHSFQRVKRTLKGKKTKYPDTPMF
jgi:hypothetical protein